MAARVPAGVGDGDPRGAGVVIGENVAVSAAVPADSERMGPCTRCCSGTYARSDAARPRYVPTRRSFVGSGACRNCAPDWLLKQPVRCATYLRERPSNGVLAHLPSGRMPASLV